MYSHPIIDLVEETGVVAIIRRSKPFDALAIAQALVAGGVRVLEITLDSHQALEAIRAVRSVSLPAATPAPGRSSTRCW